MFHVLNSVFRNNQLSKYTKQYNRLIHWDAFRFHTSPDRIVKQTLLWGYLNLWFAFNCSLTLRDSSLLRLNYCSWYAIVDNNMSAISGATIPITWSIGICVTFLDIHPYSTIVIKRVYCWIIAINFLNYFVWSVNIIIMNSVFGNIWEIL